MRRRHPNVHRLVGVPILLASALLLGLAGPSSASEALPVDDATDQAPPSEAPVVEDTVEEAAAEAPVAENPAAEDTPGEDTTVDGTAVEDTAVEETTVEETTVEETTVEDTAVEDTADDGTAVEAAEPVAEAAVGPPNGQGVIKVTICHATASFTNPYTNPSVDLDAVDGQGGNDHSSHTGPVFDGVNRGWGDIIPPVADDGTTPVPGGGLNWPEGQAILENDCAVPDPPVTPDLSTTDETCTAESDGGVLVTVSNTGEGGGDVTITETGGFDSGSLAVAPASSIEVLVPIDEDADYDITVVDGDNATIADSPFVGTLDCVGTQPTVVTQPPVTEPTVTEPTVTEPSSTSPTVLGTTAKRVVTVQTLPETGINELTAPFGLALLLMGGVLLGIGEHIQMERIRASAKHLKR